MLKHCKDCGYFYFLGDGDDICSAATLPGLFRCSFVINEDVVSGDLVYRTCHAERGVNGSCGIDAVNFIDRGLVDARDICSV